MGGYGSIQNLLKSNKALLRKKSFFKSKKSVSDKKNELLKGAEGELEFVKVSHGELIGIKTKIKEDADKRNKFFLIISLFIITIFTTFILFSLEKAYEKEKRVKKLVDERESVINYQKRFELYQMYMEEAEIQWEISHWKNATYFYEKALENFPNDSLAIYKLHEIDLLQQKQLIK